jgi:hypothetical protein
LSKDHFPVLDKGATEDKFVLHIFCIRSSRQLQLNGVQYLFQREIGQHTDLFEDFVFDFGHGSGFLRGDSVFFARTESIKL